MREPGGPDGLPCIAISMCSGLVPSSASSSALPACLPWGRTKLSPRRWSWPTIACRHAVTICYPKPTDRPLYNGLVTQCRSLGLPFLTAEELQVGGWVGGWGRVGEEFIHC